MKKSVLILSSATLLLTACTAGIEEREPVAKEANVKHVCINERKTGLNYTSKETVEFIQNSLKKKGITSEVFTKTGQCSNLLRYSFKGKRDLITRGVITLTQLGDDKKLLGEVGYYRRGDERDISNQSGISGQIDRMIGELFKHY